MHQKSVLTKINQCVLWNIKRQIKDDYVDATMITQEIKSWTSFTGCIKQLSFLLLNLLHIFPLFVFFAFYLYLSVISDL